MPRKFDYKITEDGAAKRLIKAVQEDLEKDENLTPKLALLQVIEEHQTRFYPTIESVNERNAELKRLENERATLAVLALRRG